MAISFLSREFLSRRVASDTARVRDLRADLNGRNPTARGTLDRQANLRRVEGGLKLARAALQRLGPAPRGGVLDLAAANPAARAGATTQATRDG